MPAERVGQIHLAGHSEDGALLIDTHDGYVADGVWQLYAEAVGRFGAAVDDDRMGRGGAAVRGAGSGARPGGATGSSGRSGSGAMRPEQAQRLPLASVQAALLSRITGLELGGPSSDPASFIRGDARGSAEERLAVYAFMYRSRFVEALESQFPRLARLVGADAFADLTAAYVADRPSRHPSLRELGRALPGWLAADVRTNHAGAAGGARVGARRRLRSRRRAGHDAGRAPRLSAGALRRAAAQADRGAPIRRGRSGDRGVVGRARARGSGSACLVDDVGAPREAARGATLLVWRQADRGLSPRGQSARSARRSRWSRRAASSASSATSSRRRMATRRPPAQAFAWLSTWISDGLLTDF